ncbi:hypothetical protein BACCOPRO_02513, partial [Phocaeicola coprophilus DSM 18228 = JCM 13818]
MPSFLCLYVPEHLSGRLPEFIYSFHLYCLQEKKVPPARYKSFFLLKQKV